MSSNASQVISSSAIRRASAVEVLFQRGTTLLYNIRTLPSSSRGVRSCESLRGTNLQCRMPPFQLRRTTVLQLEENVFTFEVWRLQKGEKQFTTDTFL
jgi:hypothetical protein